MNSAPFTALALLLTTLAACNSSEAGPADSGTETEGATEGDSEAGGVEAGFRLLFPTGEWGVESGYMVVEGGPGGHASHALPLPSSVDASALKSGTSRLSKDGHWAYLCLEHEDGSEFGALYSLAGPMGSDPTLIDLGPQLCAVAGFPVFVESGQAAFLPDASDGLWALALDADAGTPVHLDTPAGGPSANFVMRPGGSEMLVYHEGSMWWHPGVPIDVQPRLVADGWLWAPTGEYEFTPRFIGTDRVLLWRDGQPLVASLSDGKLRDLIEIPAPANEGCDDPLFLPGTAKVAAGAEVTGIVCRPQGSAPYVVELQDPGGEPWVLHDSSWELDYAVSSSDGRWLAFVADYPGADPERVDGLYIADRTTRATPIFVPGEHPPVRADFCGGELFATDFDDLLHVAALDTDAPQLTALETIDEAGWTGLGFGNSGWYCSTERRRFFLSDSEGIVAIDLDTLDVDVLAEAGEDGKVLQLQVAPDGSALTYFRHDQWCDDGCPASLSMIDPHDGSTTELVSEHIPRNRFPVTIGPLAR